MKLRRGGRSQQLDPTTCRQSPGEGLSRWLSARGQLGAYLDLCSDIGVVWIECGEGFTSLSIAPQTVVNMAHKRGLKVQYEMGKKHEGPFTSTSLDEVVVRGQAWLDAGAEQLVVEARESARGVGMFENDGSFNPAFADRFA